MEKQSREATARTENTPEMYQVSASPTGNPRDLSTAALVKEIGAEVSHLAPKQLELAMTEVKADLKRGAAAAAGLSVATIFGFMTLNLLFVTAALALTSWMPAWAAGLIVAGFTLVIALAIGLTARNKRVVDPLARTRRDALRRLQYLGANDPPRERIQKDLKRARRQQQELEQLRPQVPTHAPVKDTELFGELVRHKQCYKQTVDAIRIGLANAEAELATRLAPLLPRPAEAKRTLANLLCSPGTVATGRDTITITLLPAGNSPEQRAFQKFLAQLNELPLSLPGDLGQRRLHFQTLIK